jgi:hypothetical protein
VAEQTMTVVTDLVCPEPGWSLAGETAAVLEEVFDVHCGAAVRDCFGLFEVTKECRIIEDIGPHPVPIVTLTRQGQPLLEVVLFWPDFTVVRAHEGFSPHLSFRLGLRAIDRDHALAPVTRWLGGFSRWVEGHWRIYATDAGQKRFEDMLREGA